MFVEILTTLTRDIQCESLLRMNQSANSPAIQCILISINYSYVYSTKLTKDSKNSETVLRQIRKTTKKHPSDVAKNMWKRIPHPMQQHEIPRKGHSRINLYELIKSNM